MSMRSLSDEDLVHALWYLHEQLVLGSGLNDRVALTKMIMVWAYEVEQ